MLANRRCGALYCSPNMTVNAAYNILNLAHNATARDLVLAYRRLVKRYHPDYNSDNEVWSTEKMTNLNIAYETVRDYMATRAEPGAGGPRSTHEAPRDGHRTGRRHARPNDEGPGTTFEERAARQRAEFRRRERSATGRHGGPRNAGRDTDAAGARPGRAGAAEVSPQFVRLFDKPWQFVVDGVYVYYQYGLENVHLRHQGIHRFRYRQALRSIKDGIAGLEPLDEDTVTPADATRLEAARGFSRAFLQNMLIEKYYIPSRAGTELKAYNHYNRGSTQLDRAIKHRFCHELRAPHELPTGTGTLQVVQHELITVLARYTDSTWVPESMIKMHLLDRFTAVLEAELSA